MLASNVGFAPCGTRQGLTLRLPASTSAVTPQRLGRRVVVRATADEEAELEKRLEKLRQVKGATPYGQGKAKAAKETGGPAPVKKSAPGPKVEYDFSDEVVHFEGTPAMGDLYLNLALGTTLFWLPLTIASIGRVSFVRFRFTNKRFSVTSNAPWRKDRTEVAYAEIQDIVAVGRGWGAWGDMVVTLNNGDKVELRSLENFRELKQYVLAQRDKLAPLSPRPPTPPPGFGKAPKPKGAEVTAAELMGEPEPSTPTKGDKKGFA